MIILKVQPTGYWTFFCNPAKWEIDEFLKDEIEFDTYAISSYHKDFVNEGDWGVIRVGKDKRTLKQLNGKPRLKSGIYAIVKVISTASLTQSNNLKNWTNEDEGLKERYRIKIHYVKSLLKNPVLLEDLNLNELEYDQYLIQGQMASTMPLNPLTFKKILSLLENTESNFAETYPEENETSALIEGKQIKTITNRYERNPIAREICLNYYGYDCSVCGFNFLKTYGDIGKNFIHVHHLNEISQIGKEYKINPIADLRPVCANCHSMLHKKKPAYTIEELKALITVK